MRVSIENYAVIILRNIIDKVKNKKFLYDPKCSDVFKDEILRLKGTPVICRTGSSYTQEKVIRENIPFGIQYVGHISLNDRLFSTESAMYSSLRLIEILSKTDKTLSELVKTVPTYFNTPEEKFKSTDIRKYRVIENIKKYCTIEEVRINSTDKKKTKVIEEIQKYCDQKKYKYIIIDGLKVIFKDGWAYVRASNTGPTINFRCEAKDEKTLNNLQKLFMTLIEIYNK